MKQSISLKKLKKLPQISVSFIPPKRLTAKILLISATIKSNPTTKSSKDNPSLSVFYFHKKGF